MLHDILAGRKPLSAIMCLKVSRLFGGSPEVWMRLQAAYDLKKAEQNKKVMKRVARIVPVKAAEEVRVLKLLTTGRRSRLVDLIIPRPSTLLFSERFQ